MSAILQHRIGKEVTGLGEWTVGLGDDAVLGVESPKLGLLQPRMQLDLVDRRRDLGLGQQSLQAGNLEVRDPDGPYPAVGVQLLERLPGGDGGLWQATGQWIR